jgi:hypothetical protein
MRAIPPILVLLSCFFCRCTQEILIDMPKIQPQLVTICNFRPDDYFKVKVGLTKDLNGQSDTLDPSKLIVTIAEEGYPGTILPQKTTRDGKQFYWESYAMPKSGVKYVLTVRSPKWGTAKAQSTVPPPVLIMPTEPDRSKFRLDTMSDGRVEARIPITVQLAKAPANGAYFAFSLREERTTFKMVDGRWFVDDVRSSLASFTADTRTSALLHKLSDDLFLINENYWNDNRRALTLEMLATYRIPERPNRVFIEWRTLSPEYYRYYLSLARQKISLPLVDPDALFNNVQGGVGNFSGYCIQVDTVQLKF